MRGGKLFGLRLLIFKQIDVLLLGGHVHDARAQAQRPVGGDGRDGRLDVAHFAQLHGVANAHRARRDLFFLYLRMRRCGGCVLGGIELAAQRGAGVVGAVVVRVRFLHLAQLVQLAHHLVRRPACIADDALGVAARLLIRLFQAHGQLRLHALGLAAVILRGAQLTGSLGAVALHELAHLLELFDGGLHARALGAHAAAGVADDLLRQTQPLGDGECVGFSGDADQQVVRWAQGVHVELARGVHDAGLRRGVDLELGIVRRGGDERAASARVLDDGDGQRRALGRVCARAELVKEQQRALVARLQHTHGVGHVRRECRQRLLDALLVADVGHDLVEHGHGAAVGTRDVQAALRHCREQTDGLECDGLAAGIWAGDDERVKFAAERHVDRHGGILRQQRMARAVQRELLVRERGRDGIELVGKLCLGKDEVEAHEHVKVARDVLAVRRALRRELGKDALNLGLFARTQLAQLVVRLHGGHRLDEQRRAGGRHIVHKPGHGALVLGLDRHDVALGARGDDRLLQRLGIAR